MRWINHTEAQASAFSSPDGQPIGFRVPGHFGQDRVHLLARTAFGHRAEVIREDESWIVRRRPYLDAAIRERLEKQRQREQRRQARRASHANSQPIALRGGL